VNTVGPPVVVFVAPAAIVIVDVVIPLGRTIVWVYVPGAVTVPVAVEVDVEVGTAYCVSRPYSKDKVTQGRRTNNKCCG
jgi:hypothetical protein